MGVRSLINLFGDLIFDLLSWVIFIPKTFLMALVPGKSQTYVNGQWSLPEEKRYDPTTSPIIFFIAMILWGVLNVVLGAGISPGDYVQEMLSLSEFGLISIFIGAFMRPLTFAILLQLGSSLQKKESFGRESFRKIFDVQCLHWGVFAMIGPLIGLLPVEPVDRLARSVPFLFVALPMVYMGWLESQSVEEELNISRYYAFTSGIVLAFITNAFVGEIFGDVYAPLLDLIKG
jgi:hypothetical protein